MPRISCPYCKSLINISKKAPVIKCSSCGCALTEKDFNDSYNPVPEEEPDPFAQAYKVLHSNEYTFFSRVRAFWFIYDEEVLDVLKVIGFILGAITAIVLLYLFFTNIGPVFSWLGSSLAWLINTIWTGITSFISALWHGIFG